MCLPGEDYGPDASSDVKELGLLGLGFLGFSAWCQQESDVVGWHLDGAQDPASTFAANSRTFN